MSAVPLYGQIGPTLFDNGWLPVPIIPGTKRPVPTNWTVFDETWFKTYGDHYTGVLTETTPCIDIDCLDLRVSNEILANVSQLLRRDNEDLVAREGLPPKRAVFCRAEASFNKLRTAKWTISGRPLQVEILCKGQQALVYALHPVTDEPYRWLSADTPGSIDVSDLPLLTLDTATAVIKQAEDIFKRQGATLVSELKFDGPAVTGNISGLGQKAVSVDHLISAVGAIPNMGQDWEGWNHMGMAIYGATAGSAAGWQMFNTFSRQDACYDPEVTLERWQHYDKSPPTQVGAAFLYHEAERFGWEKPGDLGHSTEGLASVDRMQDIAALADASQSGKSGDVENGNSTADAEVDKPQPEASAGIVGDAGHPADADGDEKSPDDEDDGPPWPIVNFHTPILQSNYLIEDFLMREQLGMVYGQPNVGKTFYVIDVGFCVALGKEFYGHRVKQTGVLVICAEASIVTLTNRMYAAAKYHDCLDQNVAIFGIPSPVSFWSDPKSEQTADHDLRKLVKYVLGLKSDGHEIGLIIVDTLARAAVGADENSSKDLNVVLGNAINLRNYLGCSILFTHHPGKDEGRGLRGSSLILGNVDMVAHLTKPMLNLPLIQVDLEKQRDAIITGRTWFQVAGSYLGQAEDDPMKEITSAHVERILRVTAEELIAASADTKSNRAQGAILASLEDTRNEAGQVAWMTSSELRDSVTELSGCSTQLFRSCATTLFKAKWILKRGATKSQEFMLDDDYVVGKTTAQLEGYNILMAMGKSLL